MKKISSPTAYFLCVTRSWIIDFTEGLRFIFKYSTVVGQFPFGNFTQTYKKLARKSSHCAE